MRVRATFKKPKHCSDSRSKNLKHDARFTAVLPSCFRRHRPTAIEAILSPDFCHWIFVSSLSFSVPLLAGTASWEALLRAGRHCGLLLRACARAARLWFLQKSTRRDFWHLLKKQPLASRAGTHSPLGAPPGAGQKRRQHERADENSKDRRQWKIDGLMGGALERSREQAGLHPRGVQPLSQLQFREPASG